MDQANGFRTRSNPVTTRFIFRLAARAGLVALVVAAGGWMIRGKPASNWASIEVNGDAVVGHPLRVRIHVSPPQTSTEFLVVDLHWLNRRREPQGYLSGSAPLAVPQEGGWLVFQVAIPNDEQLGYVYAVVYAGPSGSWSDRVHAAVTDPIVVRPATAPKANDRWSRWSVHDQMPDDSPRPSYPRLGQWMSALLWLAAAAACTRRWHARDDPHPPVRALVRTWILGATACVAAACWELASGDLLVGDSGRRLAAHAHLYYERETTQIVVTLAILACASWLIIHILDRARAPRGSRWMMLGLTVFAGTSAVAAISHHAMDRAAYTLWGSVAAVQWLKMASAALAFAGAMRSDRSGS
jgi:hypothetical protein